MSTTRSVGRSVVTRGKNRASLRSFRSATAATSALRTGEMLVTPRISSLTSFAITLYRIELCLLPNHLESTLTRNTRKYWF
jgi:hypothetical protein